MAGKGGGRAGEGGGKAGRGGLVEKGEWVDRGKCARAGGRSAGETSRVGSGDDSRPKDEWVQSPIR